MTSPVSGLRSLLTLKLCKALSDSREVSRRSILISLADGFGARAAMRTKGRVGGRPWPRQRQSPCGVGRSCELTQAVDLPRRWPRPLVLNADRTSDRDLYQPKSNAHTPARDFDSPCPRSPPAAQSSARISLGPPLSSLPPSPPPFDLRPSFSTFPTMFIPSFLPLLLLALPGLAATSKMVKRSSSPSRRATGQSSLSGPWSARS